MNSNVRWHVKDLHQQTYKGEGEFACDICRSRFVSRLGLVRHLRGNRHAGEPEAKAMAASLDRRRKSLPIQESPSPFNWEEILNDFGAFLMGHDGGAHEESTARDRVQLIRHIMKDCEFHDLQSFSIEGYKEKHVQKLEKEKKTPATFMSHSNAMTSFFNFAIMRKLPLSFNVGEALLNLKNRRASYRKFLKKRRQVIRERDRRNALDPEEVARVMKNPLFHEAALDKKRNSHSTNMQSGKTEPKGSWGNPHVQRTSAVRNVQVEELNHGYKTKKRRWIIRVKDHKTSAKYGDASIVMPGWQKEGLDKLVQFNGGAFWEKDPGAEIRRAHGEILMAFLIIQNSQRTSAVRNMLVDELRHGYKTKKQRWIVRVQDHKTSATYGDATIVMPGWLKEGLDNLVQFNGGTCENKFRRS
ncbi:unnamed protein product [Clavelina lepadiformis]|uniref:C2H2-type domain-containing protein n=1 Tax=Clavelina lepadiformis TaxID=159417 RepID=A0ABP0G7G9_CLALP